MHRFLFSVKGKSFWIAACIMMITIAWCTSAAAISLEQIKQKFQLTESKMKAAQKEEAETYSPDNFEDAMDYYKTAREYESKGKSLESIGDKLDKAIEDFDKAIQTSTFARGVFSNTIKARMDAWKVEANKYSADKWEDAEKKFGDAIRTLEGGSEKSGKSKGEEAENIYRDAELKAIKTNLLQGTRDLLAKAEDLRAHKTAEKTYEKAKKLIQAADKQLETDRYNKSKTRELAMEAKYEAAHAIQLHQKITQIDDQDKTMEDVLLASEKYIQDIATATGKPAEFDQGVDGPVEQIIASINGLKKENAQLEATVKKKIAEISALAKDQSDKAQTIDSNNKEIASLKQEIYALKDQMGQLKTVEQQLKSDVEKRRIRKEKINRIRSSFTAEEGSVRDVNDNVVIGLYGLNFPKGKAIIQPQYFGLLRKVHDAINLFPGCHVIIEGHTDSVGSESNNLKLSSERAAAVKEYVLANTDIDKGRLEAIGYGEKKPIASNDTPDGRAKNRRIDVVIQPAK